MLPLYAIVTHVSSRLQAPQETQGLSFFPCLLARVRPLQMGSSFKSAVFADDVAEHIRGWAHGARTRDRVAG